MPKVAPHTEWVSPISVEQAIEGADHPLYPQIVGPYLLYLAPLEGDFVGRPPMALYRLRHHIMDDVPQALTDDNIDIGLDIHEYGGKPVWVFDNRVLFINRRDQSLYQIVIDEQTESVEPPHVIACLGDEAGYWNVADVHDVGSALIAIGERHTPSDDEPLAALIAIAVGQIDTEPCVIHAGSDFYSDLRWQSSTGQLAWIEWSHPNMPWQSNRLMGAYLDQSGTDIALKSISEFAAPKGACFAQLCFTEDDLYCAVDFAEASDVIGNYWNVARVDWQHQCLHAVTEVEREFGYPHWQFGDHRLLAVGSQLIGVASDPAGDALWSYDPHSCDTQWLHTQCSLESLMVTPRGEGVYIQKSFAADWAMVCFSLSKSGFTEFRRVGSQTRSSDPNEIRMEKPAYAVSIGQHIAYPTRDGGTAYAFYYPPNNPDFRCDDPAPVVVMVHGGPTARAYGILDSQKQFWTSHGFAILDINHRGSSGYGRRYRDALWGRWGEIDCSDVIDALDYAIEQGWIRSEGVCIRGKSAGGYAVLRALTEYPERFVAGASYYGIGDLATLAQITHKFERYYTDTLIGETYDPEQNSVAHSRYQSRSPLNAIEYLRAPMILFQGGQDKIVPPELAHQIADALKLNNVLYELWEYPEEGHGFKQVAAKSESLTQELRFFRAAIKQHDHEVEKG